MTTHYMRYTGTVRFTADVPFDLEKEILAWIETKGDKFDPDSEKCYLEFFEALDQNCASEIDAYMELDDFPDVDFDYSQEKAIKLAYAAYLERWKAFVPECKGQIDIFGNEVC